MASRTQNEPNNSTTHTNKVQKKNWVSWKTESTDDWPLIKRNIRINGCMVYIYDRFHWYTISRWRELFLYIQLRTMPTNQPERKREKAGFLWFVHVACYIVMCVYIPCLYRHSNKIATASHRHTYRRQTICMKFLLAYTLCVVCKWPYIFSLCVASSVASLRFVCVSGYFVYAALYSNSSDSVSLQFSHFYTMCFVVL